MFNTRFYKYSPVIMQNAFLSARGIMHRFLRESGSFRKILSELERMQYCSYPAITEWQNKRLVSLVRHSYENVPYYNRLFKRLRLRPGDIKDSQDLEKLPFLTKEEVRVNADDLMAKNVKRLCLVKTATSGSSGKSLSLYRDLYSINFENAILWRQRRWLGVDINDRIAVLRSEQIVPFKTKKLPLWRYSFSDKKLYLSSYHLSKKNCRYYVKALEEFKPAAISAMPAALYLLARFIEEEGLSPLSFSLKAIFTSSDMVFDKHKEYIERVFRAPMHDFYGSTERVAAIGMCEHRVYHVFPESGIIEFIKLDNRPDDAEIVGTNLHNYAMPLLRYRTGDMAEIIDLDCRCKRHFKTVKGVTGRISDFMIHRGGIITVEGSCLILKGARHIVEAQIIQEDIERIKVKFIPGNNFSEKDRKKIIENARTYMGPSVNVVLEETDNLMKEGINKFKPFISYVNKEW